ncbi:MAG: transposase [Pseudomonadota bacterium]
MYLNCLSLSFGSRFALPSYFLRSRKTFDALDWLAQLVMHIPDRYEQTVRYYGFYSNKLRGLRKKRDEDDEIPTIIPGEMS